MSDDLQTRQLLLGLAAHQARITMATQKLLLINNLLLIGLYSPKKEDVDEIRENVAEYMRQIIKRMDEIQKEQGLFVDRLSDEVQNLRRMVEKETNG
jgi:hypothetical protein